MASDKDINSPGKSWQWTSGQAHLCLLTISLALWLLMGQLAWWRTVLVVGLSFASFTAGALAGFLFTSYGEENATLGRVREWLIGGLTGLTIANVGVIKAILLTFAFDPGPREFAIAIAVAITYVGLGFFYMFFQRELILNVHLARSRALRGRVDGTIQAGIATQKLLVGIPPSMLARIDSLDDTIGEHKSEFESLKKVLYADDVSEFLKEADEALGAGAALDWDVVSKAAYLNYYRTYYESGESRELQEQKAEEWILRALLLNPQHGDLTARYADVLWMQDSNTDAVVILERLMMSTEAPAFVQQWLGYFLLFVPNREDDAIRISKDYHARFPDENDTFFNIACAYAQKYSHELRERDIAKDPESPNRSLALKNLREGLKAEPEYAKTVREEWIEPDGFFHDFIDDEEFRQLVRMGQKNSTEDGKNAK